MGGWGWGQGGGRRWVAGEGGMWGRGRGAGGGSGRGRCGVAVGGGVVTGVLGGGWDAGGSRACAGRDEVVGAMLRVGCFVSVCEALLATASCDGGAGRRHASDRSW